jgi:hypothetical protein
MKFPELWEWSKLRAQITLLSIVLISCNKNEKQVLADGESLARKYCASCHLFPDPELLSKSSWTDGVLPAMAGQFGIEVLDGNVYLNTKQSVLSARDWAKIIKYYKTLAPDTLKAATQNRIAHNYLDIFQLRLPKEIQNGTASTLMAAFAPKGKDIFLSNSEDTDLLRYDTDFNSYPAAKLASSAIGVHFSEQANAPDIVTSMGGMRALDITKGQIVTISKNGKQQLISNDLTRPVETLPLDYDKDGLTDYLVCAFGHQRGGLYILKQKRDHTFQKIPVREVPGATHSTIRDFNNDGWPDIMTLFAHGDEGIWLFTNNRKGGFTEKNILRFPAVFGSASFQLVDMNRDGLPDILYTAGDNSDYSRILKPYHGVYIFTNQGNFQFKQTFFYPINGSTNAMAADFDLDGDMDIASIAFFADLKNKPEETFTYLENNGSPGTFWAKTAPIHQNGRWICMDVNDWDGDGDQDIVLGNYSKGFLNQENIKPHWNTRLPFVILENKTHDDKSSD